MRHSALLLPLAFAGCVHTGAFQTPDVLPARGVGVEISGTRGGAQGEGPDEVSFSPLSGVDARLGLGLGRGTQVALHGAPGTVGGSGRIALARAPLPLVLFAGGGRSRWTRPCAAGVCRLRGTGAYAGLSYGLTRREVVGSRPYAGVRYVYANGEASETEGAWGSEAIKGSERRTRLPRHQAALSLGLAPRRTGLGVEGSVYLGPSVAVSGGVFARVRLGSRR